MGQPGCTTAAEPQIAERITGASARKWHTKQQTPTTHTARRARRRPHRRPRPTWPRHRRRMARALPRNAAKNAAPLAQPTKTAHFYCSLHVLLARGLALLDVELAVGERRLALVARQALLVPLLVQRLRVVAATRLVAARAHAAIALVRTRRAESAQQSRVSATKTRKNKKALQFAVGGDGRLAHRAVAALAAPAVRVVQFALVLLVHLNKSEQTQTKTRDAAESDTDQNGNGAAAHGAVVVGLARRAAHQRRHARRRTVTAHASATR